MAFVLFISSDNPASVPKRPFFKAQRRWNRCRCFFSEPVIATHRWQSGEPSRPSNLLDSFESTSWLCGARPCWRFACRIHCMAAASWHASRDRLQSFLSPGSWNGMSLAQLSPGDWLSIYLPNIWSRRNRYLEKVAVSWPSQKCHSLFATRCRQTKYVECCIQPPQSFCSHAL